MSDFDPWTATFEQAKEAQALEQNNSAPDGALFQFVAAQELIANQKKIINGDGFGVLQAVAECALRGLVMPDWLAAAYLKRYRAVLQCKVDSWDSDRAFGKPYRKGIQLAALRRKRINRIKVINAVADAIDRNPERPIDTGFWEEIGQMIGEGKTSAQELHAQAVRLGYAVLPSDRKESLLSNGATRKV